MNKPVTCLS